MNGEENVDDKDVDEELAKIRAQPKNGRSRKMRKQSGRLTFCGHARRRMAQRGMRANVVYAIWRVGEERRQSDGRRVYVLTRDSLEVATSRDAELLEEWHGCAIVVTDDPEIGPMLVTVLNAGEDTRVVANDCARRKPNKRWRE